jgi:hypothetical protein
MIAVRAKHVAFPRHRPAQSENPLSSSQVLGDISNIGGLRNILQGWPGTVSSGGIAICTCTLYAKNLERFDGLYLRGLDAFSYGMFASHRPIEVVRI